MMQITAFDHDMALHEDMAFLKRAIAQGQGHEPADLVLRGGAFLDLVTGDLVHGDIALCAGRIVGTGGSYDGHHVHDVSGLIAVPGFIDTHLHIESSLVTPAEFDRCVLPHGVTTAICDPHEIANVLGAEGIRYFLDCAEHTLMDIRVQLSSCVPATDLETSGARLGMADLLPFAEHPKVIGLAEVMNFPGVLAGAPDMLEKLAAFQGRHIDGHAPLVRGRALDGYCAAGIRTDHEATTAAEAREKLGKGMSVLVREGSVSKDLHALAPLITPDHAPYMAFCTDDRNPLDIAEEGHLDFLIRTAISLGARPLDAYRMASHSAARAFRLHDRGLIAPGYRGDLVFIRSLEACDVQRVYSNGRLVDAALFATRKTIAPVGRHSVKARKVSAFDFILRTKHAGSEGKMERPVMGVVPGKIITAYLKMDLPCENGVIGIDLAQDAVKVAVVERHGRNGNIGLGHVHGFGLKRGAIASSVGHDSHNITVIGVSEDDMAAAVNRLGEIEGGFVVVENGKVLAELALPVAGLMSLESHEYVHDALLPLREAAKSLDVVLAEPFLQVAFLPLPVIPHLKITDRGLVDVDKFAFVDV